jgi:hypothetical protein
MTETGDDLPEQICAPGDHDWQQIDPAEPLPESEDLPAPLIATHRCQICGVLGMMEILNDGRPPQHP